MSAHRFPSSTRRPPRLRNNKFPDHPPRRPRPARARREMAQSAAISCPSAPCHPRSAHEPFFAPPPKTPSPAKTRSKPPISLACSLPFSPPRIDLKNGRPQPTLSVIRRLIDATPRKSVSPHFPTAGTLRTLHLGAHYITVLLVSSIREVLTEGAYSYRSATIGSTRIALRTGI